MIEQDIGLGTAYERQAIYSLLLRWCGHRLIKTAMEGPIDGMAGIPGLHLLPLAHKGVQVTVIQPSRRGAEQVKQAYRSIGALKNLETIVETTLPPDRTFDLLLSFNALPALPNWRMYLQTLMERTKYWALILVTNPSSYGVWLRRFLRRFEGDAPRFELFDHEATHRDVLRPELQRYGHIVQEGYVDCPWWPDLFVSAGQTLAGDLRSRIPGLPGAQPAPRFVFSADHFPYHAGRAPDRLETTLKFHPSFEGAGSPWSWLFGHHQAFLLRVR